MDLFLSYAREDADTARKIYAVLRKEGHKVFLDQEEIDPGEDYNRRIREAIEASDLMVFLVTEGSTRSNRYTMLEVEVAEKRWPNGYLHVLPVQLEEGLPSDLPPYLRALSIQRPVGSIGGWVALQVADIEKKRRNVLGLLGATLRFRGWSSLLTLALLLAPLLLVSALDSLPPWPISASASAIASVTAMGVGILLASCLRLVGSQKTLLIGTAAGCVLAVLLFTSYLMEHDDCVTNSDIQDFLSLPVREDTLRPEVYAQVREHVGPGRAFETLAEAVDTYRGRPGQHDAASIWKPDLVADTRWHLLALWLGGLASWALAVTLAWLRPTLTRDRAKTSE